MRPTAKPVNPMWDGYKIDIVPHLMDPEGKPVKLLERIAGAIADQYETDVSAKISFENASDYRFEFFLENQNVSHWIVYSGSFIEHAFHDDTFLEEWIVQKYFRIIDKLIANQQK